MKKICLTLILVAFGVISLSQTFYVHIARHGGLWIATGNRNSMIRIDGVSKNKSIVPQNMDNITGVNSTRTHSAVAAAGKFHEFLHHQIRRESSASGVYRP